MTQAELPWNRYHTRTPALRVGERPDTVDEAGQQARCLPVIVLGAGLAGCWLARLLAEQGVMVMLIEAGESVASGASGNPAGIVKAHVTRSPCAAMAFHVQAVNQLLDALQSRPELAERHGQRKLFTPCGVLQLVNRPYSDSRVYQALNSEQATRIARHPIDSPALHFVNGGWLDPAELCRRLIGHPLISLRSTSSASTLSLCHADDDSPFWRIDFHGGQPRFARRLVLANGHRITDFVQTRELPIVPARGQISRFRLHGRKSAPQCVITGKHYVIPDGDSVIVGASFEREVCSTDIRETDHLANLAGLRSLLPELAVHDQALQGRAGIRATTPDRLPIAGPAPDLAAVDAAYSDLKHGRPMDQYPALPCHPGLYVLGGLGSRGIVTAPLAAQCLARRLMSTDAAAASADPAHDWTDLLNPVRFRIRDLKRGLKRKPDEPNNQD